VRETILECPEVAAKYPRFLHDYKNALTPERRWKTYIHVLIGKTGTGKTRAVFDVHPMVWTKPPGGWYDGYEGQEYILIDDFDGKDIEFRFILQLLDRYPLQVPVKCSFRNWVPKKIFITSNLEIKDWYHRDNEELLEPLLRRVSHTWHFPAEKEMFMLWNTTAHPVDINQ